MSHFELHIRSAHQALRQACEKVGIEVAKSIEIENSIEHVLHELRRNTSADAFAGCECPVCKKSLEFNAEPMTLGVKT